MGMKGGDDLDKRLECTQYLPTMTRHPFVFGSRRDPYGTLRVRASVAACATEHSHARAPSGLMAIVNSACTHNSAAVNDQNSF